MNFHTAERKRAKLKMGLQGPSGSGKTMSALLIAFGINNNWEKIAVIDTENGSANLYAHLGPFKVLDIQSPYTPEVYMKAINFCESQSIEVVIIDSISHEWDGSGGVLDMHGSMAGNSFTNWAKLTPRHNTLIQVILQSPCHIITTIRTKQDYVLVEKNGKQVPEKVGLKSIQRDGLEYDLTLVFDLDIKNNATASKDRTGLFFGKPEIKVSILTGQMLRDWCNSGSEISMNEISSRIGSCKSIAELLQLYSLYPEYKTSLQPEYEKRKRELILTPDSKPQLINSSNFNSNGEYNH